MLRLFRPRLVIDAFKVQTQDYQDPDVRVFQQRFNRKARRFGIVAPENGIYDTATREAVREYQLLALSVANSDGYVGPTTARRLGIRLRGDE